MNSNLILSFTVILSPGELCIGARFALMLICLLCNSFSYSCRLFGGIVSITYVVDMWSDYGLVGLKSRIGLKEIILTSAAMA